MGSTGGRGHSGQRQGGRIYLVPTLESNHVSPYVYTPHSVLITTRATSESIRCVKYLELEVAHFRSGSRVKVVARAKRSRACVCACVCACACLSVCVFFVFVRDRKQPVSYTHLTLPTIYSV